MPHRIDLSRHSCTCVTQSACIGPAVAFFRYGPTLFSAKLGARSKSMSARATAKYTTCYTPDQLRRVSIDLNSSCKILNYVTPVENTQRLTPVRAHVQIIASIAPEEWRYSATRPREPEPVCSFRSRCQTLKRW